MFCTYKIGRQRSGIVAEPSVIEMTEHQYNTQESQPWSHGATCILASAQKSKDVYVEAITVIKIQMPVRSSELA